MWVAAIIMGISFIILMGIHSPYLFLAFFGILCTFAPILTLTPAVNFQRVFASTGVAGYILLLVEGLVIIALCYPMLFRLNQILKTST